MAQSILDSSTLLPVFDLDAAFPDVNSLGDLTAEQKQQCDALADCLVRTGCLLVRDQRVPSVMNDTLLDMLERYFETGDKMQDARPELSYQVGVTPSGVEVPRVLQDVEMQSQMAALPPGHTATMPKGPDAKWRYMWRVGPRPQSTAFPELNAEPVVPGAFPQWPSVMDGFANAVLAVAKRVACCAALGLGLDGRALVALMDGGPHLLAPTGSDLGAHGSLGTVLAGYHSDLNLLTLHGKSRFPGLSVWLADGSKVAVRVPHGCLLVQAGQQLERLTGGHIKAGMHEVVVEPSTLDAVAAARSAGSSLWRISSTLFTHVASDALLQPLGRFATLSAHAAYPPLRAGEQVRQELAAISLQHPKPASAAAMAEGVQAEVASASPGEGTGQEAQEQLASSLAHLAQAGARDSKAGTQQSGGVACIGVQAYM